MAQTLAELDYSVIQQCMHCGMCLPTCPTYDTTLRERNSPRGRIALMRAVADGEMAIDAEFASEMSYCLGCLACQTACPAGVNFAELLETARNDVERSRVNRSWSRSLARALTLRFLFMSPRRLRLAGRLMRLYQTSGLESAVHRKRLTRFLPSTLRRLEPQTPRIAPAFSNELIKPHERQGWHPPRYRVALLTGCVQDVVTPGVNRDTADVLMANDCAVDTPPWQPCCGSLHAHNGDLESARTLARRMLDLIHPDRYDAIITNAGGCGSHLRHYGTLLAEDYRYSAAARQWDTKLRDVNEWLTMIGCRAAAAAPFDLPVVVTYHDSCHLAHGQRIVNQPRAILSLIPGVTLVPLAESSWCCGSAGIYNITQPEQSAALLTRKIDNILATGASVVASANPGCHLQIARGLREADAPIHVMHTVSLLARAYRREAAGVTMGS